MKKWGIGVVAAVMVQAGSVYAQTTDERFEELERKIDVLSAELERERIGDIFIPATESRYGLGPAASKIYQKTEGLSIGGYGEALYENYEGDKASESDFLRAVLYVGHKFNDRWVLNTEFEFEHASTSEDGSVAVEFAYIDYLWKKEMNFRAGLVLIPMGFINELHEPTTFLGAQRPDVERYIIPTTWRENGGGVFGEIGDFTYKAFLVNGFRGADFSASGFRDGRQKGSEAIAEDFAGVLNLEWRGVPGLLLGASGYYGDSGQDLGVSVNTAMVEAHAEWRWRGLSVRGLAVRAEVDDVAELNRIVSATEDGPIPDSEIDSIGETLTGWYVEVGYDIMSEFALNGPAIIPFVRYEKYNSQDAIPSGFKASGKYDVEITAVGVNVKPIDPVVFKAEYKFVDRADGSGVDQFNLAMGYIF